MGFALIKCKIKSSLQRNGFSNFFLSRHKVLNCAVPYLINGISKEKMEVPWHHKLKGLRRRNQGELLAVHLHSTFCSDSFTSGLLMWHTFGLFTEHKCAPAQWLKTTAIESACWKFPFLVSAMRRTCRHAFSAGAFLLCNSSPSV